MSVDPRSATLAQTYAVASIGRRFAAWIIDLIGLAAIAFIAGVLLGLAKSSIVTFTGSNGSTFTNTTTLLPTEWANTLLLAASAVYCIPLWRIARATIGQRLLGLRVVAADDQPPLGWARAAVRWAILFGWALAGIASAVSGIFTFVALLWPVALLITAWRHPQRQGLHDRYAQSMVIRRQRDTVAPAMPVVGAPPGATHA
jgi:uncharacterized RDD family membrane protein YckC